MKLTVVFGLAFVIIAILALSGCANQLGSIGERVVGETVQFNDTVARGAFRAPCLASLGSVIRTLTPPEEQMALAWAHTFCLTPQSTPDTALPLPLSTLPPVLP